MDQFRNAEPTPAGWREAERDVILCGAPSRPSCDEKKKVPVTGTNVSKVSSSKSCVP
jgi:hypothetical protein